MGTNYYWYEKPACACCGREYEPLHIGKSSAGWCFGLHVIPEEGIHDLDDWLERFACEESLIRDEYGDIVDSLDMIGYITRRSSVHVWTVRELLENHAVSGPNNLARHQLGYNCVKHGEGTWDCIEGEFS
jgi:hypothetical protein